MRVRNEVIQGALADKAAAACWRPISSFSSTLSLALARPFLAGSGPSFHHSPPKGTGIKNLWVVCGKCSRSVTTSGHRRALFGAFLSRYSLCPGLVESIDLQLLAHRTSPQPTHRNTNWDRLGYPCRPNSSALSTTPSPHRNWPHRRHRQVCAVLPTGDRGFTRRRIPKPHRVFPSVR
jgi:hypothetical protein